MLFLHFEDFLELSRVSASISSFIPGQFCHQQKSLLFHQSYGALITTLAVRNASDIDNIEYFTCNKLKIFSTSTSVVLHTWIIEYIRKSVYLTNNRLLYGSGGLQQSSWHSERTEASSRNHCSCMILIFLISSYIYAIYAQFLHVFQDSLFEWTSNKSDWHTALRYCVWMAGMFLLTTAHQQNTTSIMQKNAPYTKLQIEQNLTAMTVYKSQKSVHSSRM